MRTIWECAVKAMRDEIDRYTDGCLTIDGDVDLDRVFLAAIRAIREPTYAMVRAGWEEGCYENSDIKSVWEAEAQWRAMIDTILEEQPL